MLRSLRSIPGIDTGQLCIGSIQACFIRSGRNVVNRQHKKERLVSDSDVRLEFIYLFACLFIYIFNNSYFYHLFPYLFFNLLTYFFFIVFLFIHMFLCISYLPYLSYLFIYLFNCLFIYLFID